MSDALLDQLTRSPRLGLYVKRLQGILDRERAGREAFYETMSEAVKQEFINGEVVVHSPVKLRHERVSSMLFTLCSAHVKKWHLGYVAHEKLLVALTRNDYEPDIVFFREEVAAAFKDDQMKFPPPDFIVEVLSQTTEATDRQIKFDDYAAHGVREYWIVDPEAEFVEQYLLRGDGYRLQAKTHNGTIRSEAISDLEFPVRAIFDEEENLAVLKRLLA